MKSKDVIERQSSGYYDAHGVDGSGGTTYTPRLLASSDVCSDDVCSSVCTGAPTTLLHHGSSFTVASMRRAINNINRNNTRGDHNDTSRGGAGDADGDGGGKFHSVHAAVITGGTGSLGQLVGSWHAAHGETAQAQSHIESTIRFQTLIVKSITVLST